MVNEERHGREVNLKRTETPEIHGARFYTASPRPAARTTQDFKRQGDGGAPSDFAVSPPFFKNMFCLIKHLSLYDKMIFLNFFV